jgi:murein DD-endopeptidase MepM/ murein hydrolase activator NlpD
LASILAGTVVEVKNNTPNNKDGGGGLGNTIVIESKLKDGSTIFIKYAHLSQDSKNLNLVEGSPVKEGDQIGISGNTGNVVTRPAAYKHVHIEASTSIQFDDSHRVNPENYMDTKFDGAGKAIPKAIEPTITPPANVLYNSNPAFPTS